MSNPNPVNHALPSVKFEFGYIWEKDCFFISLKSIDNPYRTNTTLKAFLTADDLLYFGKDMVREGEEYNKDPEQYKEKMRTDIERDRIRDPTR